MARMEDEPTARVLVQARGPEHASFLRFEQEDRQEGHDDDEQRKEERRTDLLGCVDKNLPPLRFRHRVGIVFLPFRQMAVAVFDHHNGGIDKHANSQSAMPPSDMMFEVTPSQYIGMNDTRTAMGKARIAMSAERKWKQEDDDDQADDDGFFQQIALEGGYRIVDEAGTIVSRHDLDAGWKRRRDLTELLLHSIDDVQRIHALAHDDDAADGFPSPFHSATPSRMSGPKLTVPKSRNRTGVPFLLPTATDSRSLRDFR